MALQRETTVPGNPVSQALAHDMYIHAVVHTITHNMFSLSMLISSLL